MPLISIVHAALTIAPDVSKRDVPTFQAKEENQKMKAALVATPSVVHGNGENADPNEDANNVAPDP